MYVPHAWYMCTVQVYIHPHTHTPQILEEYFPRYLSLAGTKRQGGIWLDRGEESGGDCAV